MPERITQCINNEWVGLLRAITPANITMLLCYWMRARIGWVCGTFVSRTWWVPYRKITLTAQAGERRASSRTSRAITIECLVASEETLDVDRHILNNRIHPCNEHVYTIIIFFAFRKCAVHVSLWSYGWGHIVPICVYNLVGAIVAMNSTAFTNRAASRYREPKIRPR